MSEPIKILIGCIGFIALAFLFTYGHYFIVKRQNRAREQLSDMWSRGGGYINSPRDKTEKKTKKQKNK